MWAASYGMLLNYRQLKFLLPTEIGDVGLLVDHLQIACSQPRTRLPPFVKNKCIKDRKWLREKKFIGFRYSVVVSAKLNG